MSKAKIIPFSRYEHLENERLFKKRCYLLSNEPIYGIKTSILVPGEHNVEKCHGQQLLQQNYWDRKNGRIREF